MKSDIRTAQISLDLHFGILSITSNLTRARTQIHIMSPPANSDPMLLLSAFDCHLCKATLAEPHALSCGHLLCYGCIKVRKQLATGRDDYFRCPACDTVIDIWPRPANQVCENIHRYCYRATANFTSRQVKDILARWIELLPEGTIKALITTRLEAARQAVEYDGQLLALLWRYDAQTFD